MESRPTKSTSTRSSKEESHQMALEDTTSGSACFAASEISCSKGFAGSAQRGRREAKERDTWRAPFHGPERPRARAKRTAERGARLRTTSFARSPRSKKELEKTIEDVSGSRQKEACLQTQQQAMLEAGDETLANESEGRAGARGPVSQAAGGGRCRDAGCEERRRQSLYST